MNLGKKLNYMMYKELSQFNTVYYENFLSHTKVQNQYNELHMYFRQLQTVNTGQSYLNHSFANIFPLYHIISFKNFAVVF